MKSILGRLKRRRRQIESFADQAVQDVLQTAPSYRILRQELGLPGMTLLYGKKRGESR